MRFRLFGIPVQVQPWFWLTTVLLGLPTLMSGDIAGFAVWVVVLLFAILGRNLLNGTSAYRSAAA